jgi:hypothetical protein
MSSYFGFRVVSGRVGSVIGSSSVGSFRVSDHIRLGRVGYRVIYCQIISGFESYQTRLDQIGSDFTIYVSDLVRSNESDQIEFLSEVYLSHARFTLISIELNYFIFISSIYCHIYNKFHLKDMLNY